MKHAIYTAEIVGYNADFDRMAKSQGIYELTKGFNLADTLSSFFPDEQEDFDNYTD